MSYFEVDMKNLIEQLREFAKDRDWDQFHSPKNLAMALSVEVAELVEHFQWLTEDQSYIKDPAKLEEIKQEIGDILIYLTRLSDKLGIDPMGAAKDKIEINNKKYPVEMVKGSARKYNEG
ncbi:MAG: nucleotide pyrophosphohydrolase [Deltaproteobacteria bacterium]|nr:nucleotide pyrophosphohydrolase [Deltaproteobacteria bacterium]MBW2202245.1 nucleotide pyrophosphohydrolase [Deltaproteobacteria bacterium]MBW2538697.1 nucleotide pyrophosphohydrolase [Deltaproteobacteria bacterium]